eukprot:CAMPEP_0175085942 /NCGR_PEP_ID=MMETSP0052_2-20121109/28959_1 /TAXON_ID=51329 ORGANISM="Polytomella parva, Strain SAG 63-3" /NCGR_SAMPLE_ID=MMETSP0052_2 /ASSEMBLY_ACC=CAM_ASM_000194 /LENGTH=372 /DNA_ID=CAMNT_0016358041 /DNA_START=219 /DNA_END=1337 /DNA_ORIENTATION=+
MAAAMTNRTARRDSGSGKPFVLELSTGLDSEFWAGMVADFGSKNAVQNFLDSMVETEGEEVGGDDRGGRRPEGPETEKNKNKRERESENKGIQNATEQGDANALSDVQGESLGCNIHFANEDHVIASKEQFREIGSRRITSEDGRIGSREGLGGGREGEGGRSRITTNNDDDAFSDDVSNHDRNNKYGRNFKHNRNDNNSLTTASNHNHNLAAKINHPFIANASVTTYNQESNHHHHTSHKAYHRKTVSLATSEGSEYEGGCGVCFDASNSVAIKGCQHRMCANCYLQLLKSAEATAAANQVRRARMIVGGGRGGNQRGNGGQGGNGNQRGIRGHSHASQEHGKIVQVTCPFCRGPVTGYEYRIMAALFRGL